ncbi:hypothetical protein [Candidatus Deferrimicrobium sp.]|uniref:hypothetical protein n=1 Tax=Candidatus Deferrimicrobium sp. TaxID=3060586 RepID=UPI00271D3CFC|nr:hypothetical protein [Candidatus Deferrimicrobium sp.]MDO8737837.1 hypothetical protein [Candidatus Deferrimicrobium sp.]
MKRVSMVMVAFLTVISIAGYAESADDSSVPQGKESSPPGTTSNFEGIWSGVFSLGMSGNVRQDITITIGKKNAKGSQKTTYAWGMANLGPGGIVSAGSFDVYGREQDGYFRFEWKNKAGSRRTIKMEKLKDDVAKVRLEQEGVSVDRPYYEANFKRK